MGVVNGLLPCAASRVCDDCFALLDFDLKCVLFHSWSDQDTFTGDFESVIMRAHFCTLFVGQLKIFSILGDIFYAKRQTKK